MSFLIISFLIINYVGDSLIYDEQRINEKYFTELDLKLSGVICNIEEQSQPYHYLITLKNIDTNYKNYIKNSPLRAYFCITKNNVAVFADHYEKYEVGDSILIGNDKTNLIQCISSDGKIKMTKKRENGKLFTIEINNERMLNLLNIGCK